MTNRSDEELLEITRYALKTGDESVSEQYEEVQSVRLRASFLITVNALTSALFAQFLPKPIEISILLSFAITFFMVSNFCALLVMIPSGHWRITKRAGKIIEDYVDGSPTLSAGQVFGILAIKTDEDQVKNESIVASAHVTFNFSAFFYVSSSICWMLHYGVLTKFMEGMSL